MIEKDFRRAVKTVSSRCISEKSNVEREVLIEYVAKARRLSERLATQYVETCLKRNPIKYVLLGMLVVLVVAILGYLMNSGEIINKKNISALIAAIVVLGGSTYYCLSARSRKAKSIWQEREISEDGAKKAIEEIFQVYQHKWSCFVGKRAVLIAFFLSLIAVICLVNAFDTDISVSRARRRISRIDSMKDIDRIAKWLSKEENEKLVTLLMNTYTSVEGDVEKRYKIAAVTYRLAEMEMVPYDIFSSFSEDIVSTLTDKQLDEEYEMEFFIPILASVGENTYLTFMEALQEKNVFDNFSMSYIKKVFSAIDTKALSGSRDSFVLTMFLNNMRINGYIDRAFALNIIEKNISSFDLNKFNTSVMANQMQLVFEAVDSESQANIIEQISEIKEPNVQYVWFLADYLKSNSDIHKIMSVYDELGSGYDSVFLRRVFMGDSIGETRSNLKNVDNLDYQKAIIKSSAANHKEINDVLAFIHLAAEYDVKPLECYSGKIVVDFETKRFNPLVDKLGKYQSGDRWLVIHRTEIEETLEFRSYSRNQFSWETNDIDLFGEEYESNNSIGEKAYIIQLDIESMNNLPISKIPPSVDECDFILVLDAQYVRRGSIIRTKYEYKYDSLQFENSKRIIHAQKQYPMYASIQFIDVYNAHSSELYYRFAYNIVESELQLTDLDKYDYDSEKEMEQYYIRKHDLNWIEDEKNEALNLLKKNDWNINLAIIGAKSKNKN